MAAGESGRSGVDANEVDRAIRHAEQTTRYEFSVFVGSSAGEEPRDFAHRLHRSLVVPARSVLVMVDPGRRVLEIVTGEEVRHTLGDPEVELAVGHMRNLFAEGELTAGVVRGVQLLAEYARGPRILHRDA